jgi:CRISPR type IV-associated protein Csf2
MNATPFIRGTVTITTVNPVTFTHHSIDGLPLMTRGVDGNGQHQKSVFLPASQLRGRIRHEAAAAMLSRAGKVKLEAAYMAALGQDLDPEEDAEPEQIRLGELQKLRDADPLVDLFGTWKIASRLMVSHLLPEVNVSPETFSVIRRDLDANADIMGLLGDEEQDAMYSRQDRQSSASKVETQIKLAKREIAAARRAKEMDKVAELEVKIAELNELKKATKGADASENTKHLVQIEAIPAGVALLGTLVVQRARSRDVGILVEALERFSARPVLGAQLARGFGEVAGNVTLASDSGEVLVTVEFGGYRPARVAWTDAGKRFTAEVPSAA